MALDVSKVRYISLIRLEGGESILSLPYEEMSIDPDLIAGFVTAVIIFAKTPIRTIRKAAYDILIEVGETVLVLLVVDPVPSEAPYRERLLRILEDVEEKHGAKLKKFEGDVRRFREFSLEILMEFPFSKVDIDLVPSANKPGIIMPFRVGTIDSKLEQLEAFINGKRTVAEIMDLIDLPENQVLALFSMLQKYKWIDFKRRLTDNDILVNQECPEITLNSIKAQYGKPVDDMLNHFNGSMTITQVIEALPYDQQALWFLINKLVEVGCLAQKASS
ncbi:MAG: hypothetical protein ACTSV9_04910 [Candidatus Thorarchaeota archaeon]